MSFSNVINNNTSTIQDALMLRSRRHDNFVSNIRVPTCALVQTLPYNQRCDYVSKSDACNDGIFLVNYIHLLYCDLNTNCAWRLWLGVVLLLLLCAYLFIVLACTADSYFCPSLNVLSSMLGLSENVAGVTLLAFGNGASDLFTSLAGMQSETRVLFSDIFGSATFVFLIVGGCIILVKPFRVQPAIFARDCCFFILAMLSVEYLTDSSKSLSTPTCALYLSLYFFYIVIVIVDQYLVMQAMKKLKRKKKHSIHTKAERDLIELESAVNPISQATRRASDEKTSKHRLQRFQAIARAARAAQNVNISTIELPTQNSRHRKSKVGSVENLNVNNDESADIAKVSQKIEMSSSSSTSVEHESRVNVNVLSESTSPKTLRENRSKQDEVQSLSKTNSKLEYEKKIDSERAELSVSSASITDEQSDTKKPQISLYAAVLIMISKKLLQHSCESLECFERKNLILIEKTTLWKQFWQSINPISANFKEVNVTVRIFMILKLPIELALTILIPVVNYEKPIHGWSKLLNCIQLTLLPTFITFLLTGLKMKYHLPIFVWVAISTCPLALVVFFTTSVNKVPLHFKLYCILGVVGSIFIIYLCATEIINMLTVIGIATYRSNSFLGCTLLAWGNSVGDLITNTSMARQGYPKMALAACIGGPLFTSVVAIGSVYVYKSIYTDNLPGNVGQGIMGRNSIIFLLVGVPLMLFAALVTNFTFRRSMGAFMIILYGIYFIYALSGELESIHPYGSDHRLDMKAEPADV